MTILAGGFGVAAGAVVEFDAAEGLATYGCPHFFAKGQYSQACG